MQISNTLSLFFETQEINTLNEEQMQYFKKEYYSFELRDHLQMSLLIQSKF